jgi:hypothetical protein
MRTALELRRRVPHDAQKFIATARASYQTVLDTPGFADTLSEYGYGAPVLQNAIALLDALSTAVANAEAARVQAVRATAARDVSVSALDVWVNQFNSIVRVATRERPETAAQPAPY